LPRLRRGSRLDGQNLTHSPTSAAVKAPGRIKVLALSPIPEEGAGCRFRVAQYIPYLRDVGIDVTISSFYTPEFFRLVYQHGHHARKAVSFVGFALRRFSELFAIGRYDLVLLYREAIPLGPPMIETLIARRGIPIVYDFDDAIFLPNVSEANKAFAFLKDPGRVARIIRRSTRVIVGNEFLAAYARRYNPAVTVIPTAVDTDRFVPRRTSEPRNLRTRDALNPGTPELRNPGTPEPLVVGWIGSPTTFPYLQGIADVLRKVAERRRFVLRVSGAGRPAGFSGLQVEDAPWSLADEVRLFNTCDIGVYPLLDDDWSRGKCGFKAIQCMACGVPVVASAVGVNREIVEDGVNSFLASTPGEWIEKLERLLTDAPLRERMATRGRETIEQNYSLRVTAPQLAAVLTSAVQRERVASVPSPPSRPSSRPSSTSTPSSSPSSSSSTASSTSTPTERLL
jgi:glycosyltransferase involved in cell wall biosynthesis